MGLCPVWECKVNKNILFKPLHNVILGIKVINSKANPAGGKDNDCADNLPNNSDGFLENVYDCQDGEYQTDDVNE